MSLAATALATSVGPSVGLSCGESGETPGVIESVLDGSHARSERWRVIAAGTVTSIEPFDPPAGVSGSGFEPGGSYLVLAGDDIWNGELATGLCELTHRISDSRLQQLADRFGASMPDTGLPSPGSWPWQLAGTGMLLLAVMSRIRRSDRRDQL